MARRYTKSELVGRPTVMTPEVIDKLRQAYLIGATDEEAAHYAGISARTIYEHIEKNPEFSQQREGWKGEPILKAKQTVVKGLGETKNAQWYLEKKAKDFRPKAEIAVEFDPAKKLLEEFGLLEGRDGREDDDAVQGSPEGTSQDTE